MAVLLVIFTDLDGTLIDHHTYGYAQSRAAVARAQRSRVPICICSSKTHREIVRYRDELGIRDPFIAENGGAVFIPKGYFDRSTRSRPECFEVVSLGVRREILVTALHESIRDLPVRVRGFHEMTPEELSSISGLPPELALMALDRECDEPFLLEGRPEDVEALSDALGIRGLHLVRGGRFFHVTGGNDKGKAVDLLIERFKRNSRVVSVGIGDSPNDIPMLLRVDIPILVKQPSGQHDPAVLGAVPHARLADGIGPKGWDIAVNELLDR